MKSPAFVGGLRLVVATLAAAALVTQFADSVAVGFNLVSFFSYFTVLSNIFGTAVFVYGAVQVLRGRELGSRAVAVRGSSVLYLTFVGIVFNTLLLNVSVGVLRPWVNTVLHVLMPIAVLVDWVAWPPHRRIAIRAVAWWMVFPLVYVAYTLVRGPIVGFYPYPFFNPDEQGGYAGVAIYCVVLTAAFVVLALLVRWLGNRRATR